MRPAGPAAPAEARDAPSVSQKRPRQGTEQLIPLCMVSIVDHIDQC